MQKSGFSSPQRIVRMIHCWPNVDIHAHTAQRNTHTTLTSRTVTGKKGGPVQCWCCSDQLMTEMQVLCVSVELNNCLCLGKIVWSGYLRLFCSFQWPQTLTNNKNTIRQSTSLTDSSQLAPISCATATPVCEARDRLSFFPWTSADFLGSLTRT